MINVVNGLRWWIGAMLVLSLPYMAQQLEVVYDRNVTIYSEPVGVDWDVMDGQLVVSAVSTKLASCEVITGSELYLLAIIDENGVIRPETYPARRQGSDSIRTGKAAIKRGETFITGPWLIEDKPELVSRIQSVTLLIKCKFQSGVERNAEIGPIMRPE